LPHQHLTNRELEVFRLLIDGLSLTAIAAQLAISIKTVSTHKANLMDKLNLASMAELMRYAMAHQLLNS
jgi:DNA-binding NarL/FixJ family response regulator